MRRLWFIVGGGRELTVSFFACMLQKPNASVTLEAVLVRSQLKYRRTFTPNPDGKPVIRVTETMENMATVERALGRQQHVSIGMAMLDGEDGCQFASNADRGLTWPGDTSTFRPNTEFEYPHVPLKDSELSEGGDGNGEGGKGEVAKPKPGSRTADWRQYPRKEASNVTDLLTLRIKPEDSVGWFVAERDLPGGKGTLCDLLAKVHMCSFVVFCCSKIPGHYSRLY